MPTKKCNPKTMRAQAEAVAEFMKSLANPNRLIITCALAEGERSVGDLEAALGFRQPSLSQQLAELRERGIVKARREAKQVFYRLADPRVGVLLATLHKLFCQQTPEFPFALPGATPLVAPADRKHPEAATFARIEPVGETVRG